jgi:hypothetical protein
MTAVRCTRGFTELDDEQIIDHLHSMFQPDDNCGNDGLPHEEGQNLACSCGFTATASELDSHFLKAFMTDDDIDRDGQRHEAMQGS